MASPPSTETSSNFSKRQHPLDMVPLRVVSEGDTPVSGVKALKAVSKLRSRNLKSPPAKFSDGDSPCALVFLEPDIRYGDSPTATVMDNNSECPTYHIWSYYDIFWLGNHQVWLASALASGVLHGSPDRYRRGDRGQKQGNIWFRPYAGMMQFRRCSHEHFVNIHLYQELVLVPSDREYATPYLLPRRSLRRRWDASDAAASRAKDRRGRQRRVSLHA
jgi:hypothetical protein